jgi:hypothetical protein
MKARNQSALIVASIFTVVFFVIVAILFKLDGDLTMGIRSGIVIGLIVGSLSYFISSSTMKSKVEFKWWQWILYVIGWLFGVANLFFWLIMFANFRNQRPFFGKKFHKGVYFWGIFVLCSFSFIYIIAFLSY